jgi:hypothetical protein
MVNDSTLHGAVSSLFRDQHQPTKTTKWRDFQSDRNLINTVRNRLAAATILTPDVRSLEPEARGQR